MHYAQMSPVLQSKQKYSRGYLCYGHCGLGCGFGGIGGREATGFGLFEATGILLLRLCVCFGVCFLISLTALSKHSTVSLSSTVCAKHISQTNTELFLLALENISAAQPTHRSCVHSSMSMSSGCCSQTAQMSLAVVISKCYKIQIDHMSTTSDEMRVGGVHQYEHYVDGV
jgi:hypothetical protein